MAQKTQAKLFENPTEAYEKLQRRDEDTARYIPPERKDWIRMNQEERNTLISDFEQRMIEVFGCFPKANWMF